MSYKSILTVATKPEARGRQLDAAIFLARKWDAHLHVVCIGVEQIIADYYYAGATIALREELITKARDEAKAVETAVRDRLAAEDIRWSVEAAVVQPGTLSGIVGQRSRFCDIVVQPKPYGKSAGTDTDIAVVETALFDGEAPVLVLPEADLAPDFADRIVLAWNESDEALHAARRALPLLKAAKIVDIAVIDPRAGGPERSDPGGPLSEMLARHGVHTEVSVLAKTMPKVSDILNQHARDRQAGLVVMGAYGHSRLREAILGGATRAMLEVSEGPVLLAH